METAFITRNGNPRLILIFLGWGMDATPFASLAKPGYDILAVSDYTGIDAVSPDVCFSEIEAAAGGYEEIVTVGWSFGVRIATDFLIRNGGRLRLTRSIAVNGTPRHIDDCRGIPEAIFKGTLSALSEASVGKFRRRMFASQKQFASFMEHIPSRSFGSLRDELATFARIAPADARGVWNLAVIGESDRIFPPDNQWNAWQGEAPAVMLPEPHFPDFNEILRRLVIDKELVASRFAGAADTYGDNAPRQLADARALWNLTRPHLPDNTHALHVLEVGTGNGTLTRLYIDRLRGSHITLWDIAPIPADTFPPHTTFRCCDAESAIRECAPESIDLLISASTLQWFNSPARFIAEAAAKLRSGGLIALSLYGPGTFGEIAEATGETLCYPTLRSLEEAAAGAALEVVESVEETFTETFASLPALLRHMRLTGVNALNRGDTPASAPACSAALRLLRRYPQSPSGAFPLTYRPLRLLLRKK